MSLFELLNIGLGFVAGIIAILAFFFEIGSYQDLKKSVRSLFRRSNEEPRSAATSEQRIEVAEGHKNETKNGEVTKKSRKFEPSIRYGQIGLAVVGFLIGGPIGVIIGLLISAQIYKRFHVLEFSMTILVFTLIFIVLSQ